MAKIKEKVHITEYKHIYLKACVFGNILFVHAQEHTLMNTPMKCSVGRQQLAGFLCHKCTVFWLCVINAWLYSSAHVSGACSDSSDS